MTQFNPKTGEVVPVEEVGLRPVTTFATFLTDQGRGRLHAQATQSLAEVAAAVLDTAKDGEVTLKIKIKSGGEDQLDITGAVTTKVPQHDIPKSIWFSDTDGNISRVPAKQTTIDDQISAARRAKEEQA